MFWYSGIGFRPVEEDDLEAIRKLKNEPSTWMYHTTIGQISKSQQKEWFHKISTCKDRAYFSVFKEVKDFPISYQGNFLGLVRFDEMDGKNRNVRVGCDIIPDERKKGYGTKVFELIKKFCFDEWGMHKIWLCVLEDNGIAIKLYENAGFKRDGLLREHVYRDGKHKNYIVMSLLEDEHRK